MVAVQTRVLVIGIRMRDAPAIAWLVADRLVRALEAQSVLLQLQLIEIQNEIAPADMQAFVPSA